MIVTLSQGWASYRQAGLGESLPSGEASRSGRVRDCPCQLDARDFGSAMNLPVPETTTTTTSSQPGVTRADVLAAYRFILGREPESESVVQLAVRGYQSVEQLRRDFLQSREFTSTIAPPLTKQEYRPDLDGGGQPIEVNCEPQVMRELLAHVERTWSRFGKENPYWSVLSYEEYRLGNFEENQEAFWESGRKDLVRLQRWLQRNQITLPDRATCLEYGCGTGRVTRWLSQEFASVVACDVSEAHLELAARAIPADRRQGVTFVRVDELSRLDELP